MSARVPAACLHDNASWEHHRPVQLQHGFLNPVYYNTGTDPAATSRTPALAGHHQSTVGNMTAGSPQFHHVHLGVGQVHHMHRLGSRRTKTPSRLTFGELVNVDLSEDDPSFPCSWIVILYGLALIFVFLSLLSVSLACCLWFGVVGSVMQDGPLSTDCDCSDIIDEATYSRLLINAQLQLAEINHTVDDIENQASNLRKGAAITTRRLHTLLELISSHLDDMRQAIDDYKPIPLIANFSMPNIFSGCNEVVVSTSCPTPAHNPFCTGAIVEYVDPGLFTTEIRCHITNGRPGLPHKVLTAIEPFGFQKHFDFTAKTIANASTICLCQFLPGADLSIGCATTIRRCPFLQNFTIESV